MIRTTVFLLVIVYLVLKDVSATKSERQKQRSNIRDVGPASTKADIPTAEQILGKLLGTVKKAPDTAPEQQLQSINTDQRTLPVLYPNNPAQARSPLKSLLGNLPLIPNGAQGATPQTEDSAALPPPPPGYHYGRPRRPHKYDQDEYGKSDGNDDEEDPGEEDDRQNDDENQDDQGGNLGFGLRRRGRGHGRQLGLRKDCGHCNCICWKGIKPHVEWVRVPVCYRPCGVCCPKHEEEGACAAICHPCCHCCHCCHCCCHQPCHCCHCCHCCRRSTLFRPAPIAPLKIKKLKSKTPNKNRIKKKKTTKKAKKRTSKRKQ